MKPLLCPCRENSSQHCSLTSYSTANQDQSLETQEDQVNLFFVFYEQQIQTLTAEINWVTLSMSDRPPTQWMFCASIRSSGGFLSPYKNNINYSIYQTIKWHSCSPGLVIKSRLFLRAGREAKNSRPRHSMTPSWRGDYHKFSNILHFKIQSHCN